MKRIRLTEPDEEADKPQLLRTIRGLQQGSVKADSLSPEDRRACVEHLAFEGYSVPEIAEILKVSERTVARDRAAIRDANALQRDPRLADQMAGRLLQEAETVITRIRRALRDKETPPAVKVDGEHRCFTVLDLLTHRLQSLGYLPAAAQRVEANLTHNVGDLPEMEELELEVQRLALMSTTASASAEGKAEIAELKRTVARVKLSDRVAKAQMLLDRKDKQ